MIGYKSTRSRSILFCCTLIMLGSCFLACSSDSDSTAPQNEGVAGDLDGQEQDSQSDEAQDSAADGSQDRDVPPTDQQIEDEFDRSDRTPDAVDVSLTDEAPPITIDEETPEELAGQIGESEAAVDFEATVDETGEVTASFGTDEGTLVEVTLPTEGEAVLVTDGTTIGGNGELTEDEIDALTALASSDTQLAFALVPLELGCRIGEAPSDTVSDRTDAQRAALLFPWQMMIKYGIDYPTVRELEAISSCHYFSDPDEPRSEDFVMPAGLNLANDDPIPHVFGYVLQDEIGARSRVVEKSHGDPPAACEATCRGACGVDCDPCDVEQEWRCEESEAGQNTGYRLEYDLYSCESHEGCRDHDEAFDACNTQHGCDSWEAYHCRRRADGVCIAEWGLLECGFWASGIHIVDPDRTLEFNHPIEESRLENPYDCPCFPTTAPNCPEPCADGETCCRGAGTAVCMPESFCPRYCGGGCDCRGGDECCPALGGVCLPAGRCVPDCLECQRLCDDIAIVIVIDSSASMDEENASVAHQLDRILDTVRTNGWRLVVIGQGDAYDAAERYDFDELLAIEIPIDQEDTDAILDDTRDEWGPFIAGYNRETWPITDEIDDEPVEVMDFMAALTDLNETKCATVYEAVSGDPTEIGCNLDGDTVVDRYDTIRSGYCSFISSHCRVDYLEAGGEVRAGRECSLD